MGWQVVDHDPAALGVDSRVHKFRGTRLQAMPVDERLLAVGPLQGFEGREDRRFLATRSAIAASNRFGDSATEPT